MTGAEDPPIEVAVVTGATGGMGRVIAATLAGRGMHVVTVARDPSRADELRARIALGPGSLEVIRADLATRAGVTAAAAAIAGRHEAVKILVNNAGAHYPEHRTSSDGLEMHVAVDYLAAYGLTVLLDRQLRRGRARVVNVASDTIRDTRRVKLFGAPRPATIDPADLADLTRVNAVDGFVPFEAYARAKLLTVTAGYDLARTFTAHGVTVNAVHPGIVATDIVDDLVPAAMRPISGLIRRFMLTPEQGAAAALRLAIDPALEGVTGRYYVRDIETATPSVSYDHNVQQRLRSAADRFLGIADPVDGPGSG
ncbi:SDR family NAD(P)-dependent oxidoreductase [Kineosporia sp. R_H_3]|uniref:SDR family NAD(P)-dependent oxidoreductase n=1 Tax=Kineosporia sp. R_H_3 TaxID=1961848 RepID=UPI000B4A94F8|nr:SDR family NAD(P)-dependent oxidoreductase [Kineosporia sp. R_H_3]